MTVTEVPPATKCPDCVDGLVEHNVLGMIVERTCQTDGCQDGLIR